MLYPYEEILSKVGRFGAFKRCILVTTTLCSLLDIDVITLVFLGASMRHWCLVAPLSNLSHSQQRYISVPAASGSDVTDDVSDVYSSCWYYAFNYTQLTYQELISWNRCARWISVSAAEASDSFTKMRVWRDRTDLSIFLFTK